MSMNGQLGLGVLLEAKDMATGVISRFGANMQSVAGKSSEAAKAIGEHMRTFGLGLTIMGAGIAGLAMLSPAIQEAKDFGKSIALVATEVDKATFSQAEMKAVTRAMSADFGRMPVDEAKSLYKAVALGANTAAKATAFMTDANRLAVAGDSELAVTVDALGGTLNAYHMSATQAHEVSDAMFTAMKSGNTTVGAIAGAIGKVAPAAYEMGISLQETLGAMAVMTNKGVEASVAVSGLHGAMANIIHPSANATAEAARLGITFTAAAVRAKGFQGFLHSITDSAKFNKDSLNKLFESVEGSGAMAMLAGDMGTVDAVMKNMANSAGSTKEGFEVMSHTLTFQGERFEALKKIALGLIGEVLEPAGAALAAFGNRILEAFNGLPVGVRAFLVKGFALVSTLMVIVGGAIAVKAAIGMLGVGLAAVGVTAASVAAAFAPVIAALALVSLAFYAVREAYDRNLGGLASMVDGAADKISLAFRALGQLFSDGGFSGDVMDELNRADNMGLKNFAIRVYVTVARIKAAFDGLATGFFDAVNAAKPSFDAFVSSLQKIGEAFSGVTEGHDATDALETFQKFSSTGEKVGSALGKIATAVVDIMTSAISFTAGVVKGLDGIGSAAKPAADAIGTIAGSISGINSELDEMNGKVSSSQSGWVTFGKIIGGVIGAVVGVVGAAAAGLMAWFNGLTHILGGIIEILNGNLGKGVQHILFGIVSGVIGIITGLIGALAKMADAAASIFGKQTGFGDKVAGFRASSDQFLKEGFGLEKHKYAEGSEEDLLNKQQEGADARAFYAPDVMPAVAAAEAQNSSSAGPSASDIGAAVSEGVKSMPPATTTIMVQIGDEKVGEIVAKQQAGDQFRTGAPVLASF